MHIDAYVDGSYMERGELKVYGSGIVMVSETFKHEEIIKQFVGSNKLIKGQGGQYELRHRMAGNVPVFVSSRNIAGEVLASITAISSAKSLGATSVTIYYDYDGVELWIRDREADSRKRWRAKSPISKAYVVGFTEISKGLEINFKHTKGHSGIYGNEEADREAKAACTEWLNRKEI